MKKRKTDFLFRKPAIVIMFAINIILPFVAFLTVLSFESLPVCIKVCINILSIVCQVFFIVFYYNNELTQVIVMLYIYLIFFVMLGRVMVIIFDIVPIWFEKYFVVESSAIALIVLVKIMKYCKKKFKK